MKTKKLSDKNNENLNEITVPTSPDYMINLVIARHIQNLAQEISHMDHTAQDVFRRYLEGEEQKHIPKWDQYKKNLLYYANQLFPKIKITRKD